jgi:hypothetical protein
MANIDSTPEPTPASAPYIPWPTRWTVFLRTFLPWQLYRFARINLKMMGIIRSRSR